MTLEQIDYYIAKHHYKVKSRFIISIGVTISELLFPEHFCNYFE